MEWTIINYTFTFSKIHNVICAMMSRYPAEALCPGSRRANLLKDFKVYPTEREAHAKNTGGFLSDSTGTGLRVTITSVLEMLS